MVWNFPFVMACHFQLQIFKLGIFTCIHASYSRIHSREGMYIVTCEKVTRVNLKVNLTSLFSALTWDKLPLSTSSFKTAWIGTNGILGKWVDAAKAQCSYHRRRLLLLSSRHACTASVLKSPPWFLNDLNTSHSCREAIWKGCRVSSPGFHWPTDSVTLFYTTSLETGTDNT